MSLYVVGQGMNYKSMLKKIDLIEDGQLRLGGLFFAVLGFIIIYYIKG